jgi:adenine phosphoribosyltransferase
VAEGALDLRRYIRAIADFPQPGILFRDITPLLRDYGAFEHAIDTLHRRYRGETVDTIAGVESRGFILGAPLALRLGVGFVPIRKAGKLPGATRSRSYALEYGTATLQMHVDALQQGQRVVLVDDLLATGGTAAAAAELVEEGGGSLVEIAFLIELADLGGRERLCDRRVFCMLSYGSDAAGSP